ncbi:MAG: UDP-N-acetylmuramoyl-tripeptide--D-alanyl-D-alanine ligase [Prolixibacteraceae bacterium]|jgi:UDP-N-acetylmuramoyl-tripeptide--D-alanyl-D-alanine ligase|nr:UDP-N-acetylmuramoyl-tripeptide--D-alanyl-D-alanine ligase [Prolixibacteraceae bacterium]
MTPEEIYPMFLNHPVVTIDSRRIEKDSIFFALKGDNFNGNAFALSALEAGAAYAVVDEAELAVHEKIILVENVLSTLQKLARLHRQKLAIPILAITGTNGKTTTKELVSVVLSKKYNLISTKGNLNNHIGVPLTLLSLRPETEFAVVEMGANHPGEIEELCRIALPDYGLITNVGRAHLEGFGSFEGVIQTKTELYRYLEQKGGTIFINNANPYLSGKAEKVNKVGYTTSRLFDGLEGETVSADPMLVFKTLFPKGWLYIKTQLVGSYNLENALSATAIGHYFGVDPTVIAHAIESYKPDNNRSQMVVTERNRILMDAYNANPSSTRAALENFVHIAAPKKGVILGDMLELGAVSQEEHQKIIDFLSTLKLDLVYLVGPNYLACKTPEQFRHFNQSADLALFLQQHCLSDYLLLIKGSRGMKLETIRPEL